MRLDSLVFSYDWPCVVDTFLAWPDSDNFEHEGLQQNGTEKMTSEKTLLKGPLCVIHFLVITPWNYKAQLYQSLPKP